MKTSCFLVILRLNCQLLIPLIFFQVLFATQVLDVSPAPTTLSTEYVSGELDFSKTYLQFFKIKDLVEKINIRKFREFQDNRENGIEGPADEAVTELTNESAVAASEENLPEIDLTEEAIINDEVSAKVTALDTYQSESEETTAAPTVAVIEEEAVATAARSVVEAAVTELATALPADAPSATLATITAVAEESQNSFPETSEEDDLLNEIDTGADKFFISKESVESANKYGYKILLKKLNGKEVPVGKIKFSFPTLVEINTVGDDDSEEVKTETVIEEEKTSAETESAESIDTTTTVAVQEPVEIAYVATGGAIIELTKTEETTTVAVENIPETTTVLAVTFLPPPLESVIPTVEVLDEYTITEGVKQITEDTEVAIKEIKNQNTVSFLQS